MRLSPYYGGKCELASRLNRLMPPSPAYLELFVGGGSVLWNRKPSKVEVLNDYDPAIANLYRVLADREMGKKLVEVLGQLPYDEHLFKAALTYQKDNFVGMDAFDYAVKTYVLLSQSRNGARRGFSRRKVDNENYQRKQKKNLLEIYERLESVYVLNMDAMDILQQVVDIPDIQIYLDCPYLHSLRGKNANKVYFKEMDYMDHVRMLKIIRGAKSRILLSGYHADKDDLYDTYLLPYGWRSMELAQVVKRCQNKDKKDTAIEWVWMNYIS